MITKPDRSGNILEQQSFANEAKKERNWFTGSRSLYISVPKN